MTDISQAARAEVAAARRSFFWVAIVFPLVLVLASTAVIVAWLPQLPNPIASHWSGSGGPDGFSAPIVAVWMNLGLGFGMIALLGGIVWFETRQSIDAWGWTQRFLGAIVPGLLVFITVLMLGMLGKQRGLSDAATAGNVDSLLWIGLVGAIVVGGLAWLVQPKVEFARPSYRGVPLELGRDERAVWIAETRMGRGALISLGILVLALVVAGAAMLAAGTPGWWGMAVVLALLLLGIATCTLFRVRVDDRGLRVRSMIGWPRFHYAPERIAAVAVSNVSPMAEYGGWGLRVIPRGIGVVMRSGEAINVTLTNGRTFVVTVDDAETGASLLQAVAQGPAPDAEAERGNDGDHS